MGQLWQLGRGAWVPLLGAIAGCYCRVPLWRALVGMVCQLWQTRVPLQGAIAMCYGGGRCESGETAWSAMWEWGDSMVIDGIILDIGCLAVGIQYGHNGHAQEFSTSTDICGCSFMLLLLHESGRCWCHCSVLWLGGRGGGQLWWSGDVVPLLGAIGDCHCWMPGRVGVTTHRYR